LSNGIEDGQPTRDDIAYFIDVLRSATRQGRTLEEAASDARRRSAPNMVPAIDAALERLVAERNRIGRLRDPRSLQSESIEPWYTGPTEGDTSWPAYAQLVERKMPDALGPIDDSTSKTLTLMPPPILPDFNSKGLVLGYVQSGKTANYIGLISKAADVGYRLFIVMTGMLEPLRKQTHGRIHSDLIEANPDRWFSLTTAEQDFSLTGAYNVNAFLAEHNENWTIAVVKKNVARLNRLATWLEGARPEILRNTPVLVIDDEADQASLNTANGDYRTRTNEQILRLLALPPKVAYVGYTASPFANLLIDPNVPQDLYPKDFIVDLPRPNAYFGPERIFGRDELPDEGPDEAVDGIDCIRSVSDAEAQTLIPPRVGIDGFVPDIPPSLDEACRYFVMAAAARRARGQGDKHVSMLIHTTTRVVVHANMRQPIADLFNTFATRLEHDRSRLLAEFRSVWESEVGRVGPVSEDERPITFDEMVQCLPAVLDVLNVVVENGKSEERLDYEATPGQVVVVIGGDVLSRGLTIEGLTVSYFLRASGAYDTLLQMGRWFGYRPGYSDLCRTWMTDDLARYFRDVSRVEQEIRRDVERYELEGLTPLDFQVRIRRHPALNITAPGKMQAAIEVERSYSGRRVQTILFHHRDPDWLAANISAVRSLVGASLPGRTVEDAGYGKIIRDLPVEHVLQFLGDYRIHEDSREMNPDLLARFIERQVERTGELASWNLVIMGLRRANENLGEVDLGLGDPVAAINRSRVVPKLGVDEATANIKALTTATDILADFPDLRQSASGRHSDFIRTRTLRHPGVGALMIYPISRHSVPERRPRPGYPPTRMELEAVDDVMGAALVFPEIRREVTVGYVSAPSVEADEELVELPEEAAE
jgi:hypothetical protein